MSNIVNNPPPHHLIHIHSMHIHLHCFYAVREPVYVMLICTESTFGAKYHGQLAAQRSCQSGLGCPLTVSLWHFNGDFISPAREERKHSTAVLVPTLRMFWCQSDPQTWMDSLRHSPLTAKERLRALITCPALNSASIFMLGGHILWRLVGLRVDLIQFAERCHWQKANHFPPHSEKISDLNKGSLEHQVSKATCYDPFSSPFQHVVSFKLVNTSRLTGWAQGAQLMSRGSAAESLRPSQSECPPAIANDPKGMERSRRADHEK